MMSDQDEASVENDPLGEALKNAREARSYSIAYVASETLLQEDIIIALEAEDYEQLPAAVFVRGYIRTYAKLLEIDTQPLIDAYNQTEPSPPASMSVRRREQKAEYKQVNHELPIISTLAVLVVVLGLTSSWWLQRDIEPPVELLSEDIPGLEDLSDTDEQAYQVGLGEISPDHASSLRPNQEEGSTATESEEEGLIERVLSIADDSSDNPPEPLVSGDAEDPVKITLTFLEESWTEIYDVRKRRLLHGLIKQGAVREVYGQAPFNIFFGNAQGVEVKINDKPFNHIPFARENKTARFLVGDGNS